MFSGMAAPDGMGGQSCTLLFCGALSNIGALSRSKTMREAPPPVVQETIVQPPDAIVLGASVNPLIVGAGGPGGTGVAVAGCGASAFTLTVTYCCDVPPGPTA